MIQAQNNKNGADASPLRFYFSKRGRLFAEASKKLRMVLDCFLNPLRLNADIPLRGGGAAVLQQPLHKGNIITVILVNLRCVPLAEAVSAYVGIVKIITDDCKLLLDCPFRDRENALRAPDAVAQTVVLNILLNQERDGKDSALPGFLLHDFQTVAVAVPDNIAKPQLQYIADTQT